MGHFALAVDKWWDRDGVVVDHHSIDGRCLIVVVDKGGERGGGGGAEQRTSEVDDNFLQRNIAVFYFQLSSHLPVRTFDRIGWGKFRAS